MRYWTKSGWHWFARGGLLLLVLALCACDQNGRLPTPLSGPFPDELRILALGDSITEGYPHHYRHALSRELHAAGFRFLFVGSQLDRDPQAPRDTNGQPPHHEGHSGWTTEMIAVQLPRWLRHYAVDLALIHLGTNDVFATTPGTATGNMAQIVDLLLGANPAMHILLAKIIPLGPRHAYADRWVADYNNQLVALVHRHKMLGNTVVIVDQHTNFDVAHLPDDVHPDEAGGAAMASVWFEAIKTQCQASVMGAMDTTQVRCPSRR